MSPASTSIHYSQNKEFTATALQDLFTSVAWTSGFYPEKLQVAMRNSHTVISAWHQGRLVGLMNALSDGIMTAYFHYLLVHPDFQKKGIGQELVARMLEQYDDVARKVLIADTSEASFFYKCGFEPGIGKIPLYVTH